VRLNEIVAAVKSGWWLAALGLLLAGNVALGLSLAQTPLYVSSTQLFVSTTDSTTPSSVYQGSEFSQERTASYVQLLSGTRLAERVVDRLGLDVSPAQVRGAVSAEAVTGTVLINVQVVDTSPVRAQAIAAALGPEFSNVVAELETPDGADVSPVKVTVTEPPFVPTSPASPNTRRDVTYAAIAGLVVGAGVAIGRQALDRSVTDAEEAAGVAGAPVIGRILRDDTLHKQHLMARAPGNRAAEDYRQLRNNLEFLNVDRPPRVIMVSSAVSSEGKTTMVANLGIALTDLSRTVAVVEADLRQPKLTSYLGLVEGPGLADVLSGRAQLEDVTQQYHDTELRLIPAGTTPPNPGELLASSQMFALLDKLRGENDFVLVDAPPLLSVADATGLARHTDGVILSVRHGRTRRTQLAQAVAALAAVGATTLGVVLNIVPRRSESSAVYGYDPRPGRHAVPWWEGGTEPPGRARP
jgi:receptor protein-tyrosine kinase